MESKDETAAKIYIDRIKSDLLERLDNSTRRIALLDSIRARQNKRATVQELRLLRTSNYIVDAATADIVALMLEAKAKKRQQKKLDYRPFLMKDDLLMRQGFDDMIKQLIERKEPFHYDFILITGWHCTPMQLDFDGNIFRGFYIDATEYPQNALYGLAFMDKEKYSQVENYMFLNGGIQSDDTSCSIFSIQHLNKLSTIPVEQRMSLGNQSAQHLAPAFLKNIQHAMLDTYFETNFFKKNQGASALDKYADKYMSDKDDKKRLQQHLEDYSISVDISTYSDKFKVKKQNYAISYKMHKYLQAALMILDKRSDLEVEAMIETRCDFRNKNIHKPTDEAPPVNHKKAIERSSSSEDEQPSKRRGLS